jgi:hypothetical protein
MLIGLCGKLTRKGTKKTIRQFSIQLEEWSKGIKELQGFGKRVRLLENHAVGRGDIHLQRLAK